MELPHSKLGTREYWDEFYNTEIRNFSENPEDTGECWFDDCGAEDRMVQYVESELAPGFDESTKILDLGTGNGHLLFSLRESEVPGQFLGIDYSHTSVKFASKIAKSNPDLEDIQFKAVDFISDPKWNGAEQFDLVLDKGTLDAIALSTIPNAPQKYVECVLPLIKQNGGRFLITSCNFTKDELVKLVGLPVADEISYPSFVFGGQKGTPVVTLIFEP